MFAHSTPEDGDVVVQQEKREGKSIYVLHTVTQAVTSATREHVRVWLTDDYNFALLKDYRVVQTVKRARCHDA